VVTFYGKFISAQVIVLVTTPRSSNFVGSYDFWHVLKDFDPNHQALKPLFQNKLRGAIYDRWLAVLQQFNVDIKYKPAAQMQVPDALSRVENAPLLDPNAEESLNENASTNIY
jgi:Trm5-related predicted tRNA methylase